NEPADRPSPFPPESLIPPLMPCLNYSQTTTADFQRVWVVNTNFPFFFHQQTCPLDQNIQEIKVTLD
uniref:Uncharacterized protein n=1 Tax=Salvator merianae TaxID=96440 RepID=A0A8D0DRR2_SALMN